MPPLHTGDPDFNHLSSKKFCEKVDVNGKYLTIFLKFIFGHNLVTQSITHSHVRVSHEFEDRLKTKV